MSKSKKSAKKLAETAASTDKPQVAQESKEPAPKPILRAIRVTAEVLDAAKAYKKATGTSFYALGLEAITEVLVREGYMKRAQQKEGPLPCQSRKTS